MRTARLISSLVPAVLLLCLLASGARAAEAGTDQTHLLNEGLSLTGDCSTSKLDTVPDPGCPGGTHPPAGPLANPTSVSTDPHGDIYVASEGPTATGGIVDPSQGHIDVFDPTGHYLTEVAVPGVRTIAVDANGYLYVGAPNWCGGPNDCHESSFLRFDPTTYEPAAGKISYDDPPIKVLEIPSSQSYDEVRGLAVDPRNQHVYAAYDSFFGSKIMEFDAAVPGEPNAVIEDGIAVPGSGGEGPNAVAVDAAHGLLYESVSVNYQESAVHVFELEAPHALVRTIDGSTTPEGSFRSPGGRISVAAEEATGDFFIDDIELGRTVYEFEEDGSYVGAFNHGFEMIHSYIHVDNSPESPNVGYLFVPSGTTVPGHAFAFQPKPPVHAPVFESVSVSGVGQREAAAKATINPEGSATHYTFEYTTEESFLASGFAGAVVGGEGDLPAGVAGVEVSAALTGLAPGTAYRFRVRAESECEPGGCRAEEEQSFATFASPPEGGRCGNETLRIGPSASLPDCRAYELVTPPDTNGKTPHLPAGSFGTPSITAGGNLATFRISGGTIPGFDGAGNFGSDEYLTNRTPSGWQTELDGPTGEQYPAPSPGGMSSDLGYLAVTFGSIEGFRAQSQYIRYPDGSFHLTGQGVLTDDQNAPTRYIAPDGTHIIFESTEQLLAGGPQTGVYDRTADGVLHLVSLLPGDIPAEHVLFIGRSDDGSTVAFGSGGQIFVRIDNAETVVGAEGAEFAGFSEDGHYMFYVSSGAFYRFDVQTGERVKIAGAGDPLPVNVPLSGSGAYFISSSKLDNKANPNGAKAVTGQANLYYWDGAETHFVATVTAEDVEGELGEGGGGFKDWMDQIGLGQLGLDPTRATRQGATLLFRSRAHLTDYDAQGHAELYRYDAVENTLACLSCDPTGSAATADAKLVTFQGGQYLDRNDLTANLSDDGRRAIFETSDRLVGADNDNLQDVYEWEAAGKGSCRQPGGCLFLISSGQSGRSNYLYGVSASGDDVLFSTSDLLTTADQDETPSIYDARVEGGFPGSAEVAGECLGEACQPAAVPPSTLQPASSIFRGAGNVKQPRRTCPKGKRAKRLHGKRRCVKKGGKRHRSHARKHRKTQNHRQGRPAR